MLVVEVEIPKMVSKGSKKIKIKIGTLQISYHDNHDTSNPEPASLGLEAISLKLRSFLLVRCPFVLFYSHH